MLCIKEKVEKRKRMQLLAHLEEKERQHLGLQEILIFKLVHQISKFIDPDNSLEYKNL